MFKLNLIATLLLIAICAGCSKKDLTEQEFDAYEVKKMDLVRTVEANGSVQNKNRVEIHPPLKGGRLETLFVKEGEFIEKGIKVAMVSSKKRRTFLDLAQGKGKKEQDYWQKQLRATPVFSPVSGKILKIHVDPGENYNVSIMRLSTGKIIRANVDESDLPLVYLGQPVKISFDASKSGTVTGKVSEIALQSKVVNNVNVYVIEVEWPKEAMKDFSFNVRLGMSVTLLLEVARRNDVAALPLRAVNGISNKETQVQSGKQKTATIKLGEVYGEFVEVLSGIKVGEHIFTPAFQNPSQKERKTPLLFNKK